MYCTVYCTVLQVRNELQFTGLSSSRTETHRGAHVAPETARLVDAHPRRGDVGGYAEVRQPQVLNLHVVEQTAQRPVERAACAPQERVDTECKTRLV